MAVYAFLREGRGEGLPGYGAPSTAWCRARDAPSSGGAGGREPHPRFETPPGRQLQFDGKEGMRLVDSEGEVFEFSVFTATLGYSRKHRFIRVRSRTLDDLLSCLLATFTRLGGVPEECITDNMSCLVTVSGGRRTRQERAWRFARRPASSSGSARRARRRPRASGELGQPLPEPPARLRRRVHRVEPAWPRRWPGSRPRQTRSRTARRRPAARRAVHAGEGEPAAHREPPPPRVDGGRRERPDRPADHARQGPPAREWSRAQALHRPARERRGDALGGQVVVRMAGEEVAVHDAASGPSEADRLRPRPLRAGPRGEAGPGRRGHRRGRARQPRAARLARRGADGRRRGGQPLDQGAGEPLRARAARDGGVPARLREDGRRGRAGLRLRPRRR